MDSEARTTLVFVLVGLIAAFASVGVDSSFNASAAGKTSSEIALILVFVAIIGYLGTYLVEFAGTNVEEQGGRLKLYSKSLYIYLITWFVMYVLLYNAIIYKG